VPASRSGAGTHAKVEGEARRGRPADDLTLRRLAGHALHREQCVVVWEIRLALLLDPSHEDCRHLPATTFWGPPLPTTSRPGPIKVTIYGWSTNLAVLGIRFHSSTKQRRNLGFHPVLRATAYRPLVIADGQPAANCVGVPARPGQDARNSVLSVRDAYCLGQLLSSEPLALIGQISVLTELMILMQELDARPLAAYGGCKDYQGKRLDVVASP
jgi:hypothetical protein